MSNEVRERKDVRIHQLESDLAMTREELRLIETRMKRIAPHRRPQDTMVERMAILELRAMRGWSKAETARRFFITDDTGKQCRIVSKYPSHTLHADLTALLGRFVSTIGVTIVPQNA